VDLEWSSPSLGDPKDLVPTVGQWGGVKRVAEDHAEDVAAQAVDVYDGLIRRVKPALAHPGRELVSSEATHDSATLTEVGVGAPVQAVAARSVNTIGVAIRIRMRRG